MALPELDKLTNAEIIALIRACYARLDYQDQVALMQRLFPDAAARTELCSWLQCGKQPSPVADAVTVTMDSKEYIVRFGHDGRVSRIYGTPRPRTRNRTRPVLWDEETSSRTWGATMTRVVRLAMSARD